MRVLCFLFSFYLAATPAVFAQRQKIITLNYALEPAPNQWSVRYEEVLTDRDTVWSVARYSMPDRKLVATYFIFDSSSRFKHGLYKAFHSNGQLADSGNYVEGYKEGWHYSWRPNGQLAATFKFRNSIPIDTGTTWDENGRITSVSILDEKGNGYRRDMYPDQQLKSFGPIKQGLRYGRWKFFDPQQRKLMEVQFETNHEKSATCFDTVGNIVRGPCIFEQGPQYERGQKEWTRFLQSNINWPRSADIPSGKVVVSFAVHTDGSIGEFEELETAHPLLTAEAIRVLKLSGKWKPAILMNQPTESRYTEELYVTQVKRMN